MLKNKKIDDFLNIIKFQVKNILAINIPDEDNSIEVNEIANRCKAISIDCIKMNNVKSAIKFINNSSQKIFLITGSLYLVGKLRKKFL